MVRDLVTTRIAEAIAAEKRLLEDSRYVMTLCEVGALMAKSLKFGHKLLFFGNGGSAADAQHLAAELAGRYMSERPSLAALALTTNTSSLTAIANDYNYDQVFARQLEGLGSAGDVAFGISTSGNSQNILLAMDVARAKGLIAVGLVGKTGGRVRNVVDYCLCVPSLEVPRIQELHILTGHIICEIIELELFSRRNAL
jgi:D-sedoheptulose 7-phosphate isomerase